MRNKSKGQTRAGAVLSRHLAKIIATVYLRKPELKELITIKYPDSKALGRGIVNESFYLLRSARGFSLDFVNLEITNNCNLNCSICPVGREMTRPAGFMQWELFQKIVAERNWNAINLFQWGEPLLHPRLPEMIHSAHLRGIRTMITTNGTLLDEARILALLPAGLDRITVSIDGSPQNHEKIRGFDYFELKEKVLLLKRLRDRERSPLKIDVSMVVNPETEKSVPAFRKDWEGVADRVQLIPEFRRGTRKRRCREIWRGAIVVLWDGRVVPCCADFDASLVLGDAREEPLEKIWNGLKMRDLRKSQARRHFPGICRECDEYQTPWVNKRFS